MLLGTFHACDAKSFLCGDVLKWQSLMLIKWEISGTFLSSCHRQDNFLTGDILSKFHCLM